MKLQPCCFNVDVSATAVALCCLFRNGLDNFRSPPGVASTHTDQYLHFSSHHPLQHKLSVIRTLLDRSINIVTEEQDRKQEEHHIQTALTHCGYPDWSISKVKSQMATSKHKKVTRKLTRQHSDVNKTTVVIPYVQDLSEAVTRVTIVMVSPLP